MRSVRASLWGIAIALTVAAGAAHAQYRPAVIDVNNEFGLAAQEFLQSYTEHYSGTEPDGEHGAIQGVGVKATGMFDLYGVSHIYAGIRFQYDHGNVIYDGHYLNSGAPLNGTPRYTINNLTGELGKGFLITDRLLITPEVEAGWRSWDRDLGNGQVENYAHTYIGAGVRGDVAVTDQLVLSGKAVAGTTIDPNMNSEGDARAGLPAMSFALGMRPFYEAQLGADYKFIAWTWPLHVFADTTFDHFSYGPSAINRYGYFEPDSNSNQFTFELGVAVGL